MEIDQHEFMRLVREVSELRRQMDEIRHRTATEDKSVDEVFPISPYLGDNEPPAQNIIVPPECLDDKSLDYVESGEDSDEDDDTVGCTQIKGFSGAGRISSDNITLPTAGGSSQQYTDEEFVVRVKGDNDEDLLEYRKLNAPGGGGGTSGYNEPINIVTRVTWSLVSSNYQLNIYRQLFTFENGILKTVGSEVSHVTIGTTAHSSIPQQAPAS